MKIISESSDGSLAKKVSVEGVFSGKPSERALCRVRIEDVDASGSELDSEYLRSTISEKAITIGDANTRIDEYVERAISTMFVGEESIVEIVLRRSKDDEESTQRVSAKLILLDFEARPPIWEWSTREKLDVAKEYKEAGVRLFKSVRIVEAFRKFSRACKILITLEPIDENEIGGTLVGEINSLRNNLYNNMVECHLIRKNFEHAISLCDKVLRRDENNVKALYRRAVARENLKDYERALEDMSRVVELEPTNLAAKKKHSFYSDKVFQAQKKYNDMVKKMFPTY